jgi:hypothetical protein
VAVDELHDDGEMIVRRKRFVDRHNIRVVEGRRGAGLFNQPFAMAGHGSAQNLQGYDPAQIPIMGGVNSPEAALSDQSHDQIAA